jgi:hypothetical protein
MNCNPPPPFQPSCVGQKCYYCGCWWVVCCGTCGLYWRKSC